MKSAVVGDLGDGVICAAQLLFGVLQTQPHDILGVGHIQILLEESGQIAFGQKLACSKLAQGNILIPGGMDMIMMRFMRRMVSSRLVLLLGTSEIRKCAVSRSTSLSTLVTIPEAFCSGF